MADKKKIALLGAGTMGIGIAQMRCFRRLPDARKTHLCV